MLITNLKAIFRIWKRNKRKKNRNKKKKIKELKLELIFFVLIFSGSLLTRNLADLVKKEHFILDSEYLTTLLVIVPK